VAGHDSFLGDADPFAQPELYSLIADAEGSHINICFDVDSEVFPDTQFS